MALTCNSCFYAVEKKIGGAFAAYGRFVARHPWKIILIGMLVNVLLGFGLFRINFVTDVQKVYTPIGSQASKDSDRIRDIFPDLSGSNFNRIQMPDLGRQGEVIVKPKAGTILDISFLNEVKQLYDFILAITTTDESGDTAQLSDICAKIFGGCSIDGDVFVDAEFLNKVSTNSVPYPYFAHSTRGAIYYEQIVGGAQVTSGILQSATMLILRVNLRTDSDYFQTVAKNWQKSFLEKIRNYESNSFDIAFAHSDSLSEELNENVSGDIIYFSITFTLMITYACMATMTARCDCVGQRSNLGFGGVIAAGLAILSAFGLVSACGVEFVSIVGAVPFLIIGIGVDDMFLLMSGITATSYDDDVETRIGDTMRTSGVSITITSLTDLLAFAAGASSIFLSVRNFCIYSGVAVIFCYINQATIFVACIAINEKRTVQHRHYATCMPVRTADKCLEDGKSSCFIGCCSGRRPRNQQEVESLLDRLPRWLIPKLVFPKPMKAIIVFIFAAYLGVSIWGVTQMKEGLDLKNLVSESSYYYKYRVWLDDNFPTGTPVSFVFDSDMKYSDSNVQTEITNFLTRVKSESTVQTNFEINVLTDFKSYAGYDDSSENAFVTSLQAFLSPIQNTRYQNDVVIDDSTKSIKALRVHVMSESIKDTQEQGHFMLRMRDVASDSTLRTFAFSPAFLFYEQYVSILSQTLQTVGIAIAMVFVVTCIFMPHPLLLVYVTVTVAMITTGIFGFLPFLGLNLSAITMIHIVMSIGFSVDFAVHICHGYMISNGINRDEQMKAAIIRSGAPIFHGAISSVLGVVILAFAKSFIFYSFFQVMSLVVTFGILHALFLLPVVLSLIGPRSTASIVNPENELDILQTRSSSLDFKGENNAFTNGETHTEVRLHIAASQSSIQNAQVGSSHSIR